MLFASSQPRIGAKIMTKKDSFADNVRDHATDDSPHAHQVLDRRRWTDVLMHRWPTALGIALAALAAYDLEIDAGSVSSLSAFVVLLALVYLGAAALDRRWSAWVLLLVGLPLTNFIPSISGIDPSVVLLAAAPVFLVLGVARGQLRKPGGLPLQTVGMLAFGSIVLVALYVDPDLGGNLVAFALISHAAWDAYHFLRNRVVPRSYAEFCIFVDLLLGAAILFMR
jgi:hypothetical protein